MTKPARGASQLERIEFAKSILRERPDIRHQGADGLNEILKAKFGTGMSQPLVNQLRELVAKETTKPMVPVTKPTTLADQVAGAINAEVQAKEALATLKSHYEEYKKEFETRIAEQEKAVKAASTTVERLIQSLRQS